MFAFTQANVFFAIFLAGAALSLLAFVLGEVFDGFESLLGGIFDFADIEIGGGEGSPGLFRALAVFFTAFGAGGWTGTTYGLSLLASTGAGAGFGLLCGGFTLALLIYVAKQQSSSTIETASMVGATGRLTLGIPASGTGRAVLSVAGARVSKPARSASGAEIASNAAVKVVSVEGDTVVVEVQQS